MASSQQPPGPAADAQGRTATDPTRNVIAIVRSEAKRQDQLRKAEYRSIRRETQLEVGSIRRELKNFRKFLKEIGKTETKRLNAIRKVDVGAVAVANTAAENRATTLATQQTLTKDAVAISLKSETDPIRNDISALQESRWTIAGGTSESKDATASGRESSHNTGMWVAIGVSVLALMGSAFFQLIGIAVLLYLNKK